MLPISDSLADICALYQNRCLSKHSKEDYFFTQKNMQKYSNSTLYKWFRKILWKANISHGGTRVRVQEYMILVIQTLIKSKPFLKTIDFEGWSQKKVWILYLSLHTITQQNPERLPTFPFLVCLWKPPYFQVENDKMIIASLVYSFICL